MLRLVMAPSRLRTSFAVLFVLGLLLLVLQYISEPLSHQAVSPGGLSSSARFPKAGGKRLSVRSLPQCVLIGVKKSGTRALFEMIKLNSGVRLAYNDVHFFDKDYNYQKGLDWYLKQMPYSSPGQVTIERTAGYFVYDKAPERIYQMNPSVKLLLIVREPVARMVSDYTNERVARAKVNKDYPPIESLLMRNGTLNLAYPALRRSLYYQHLLKWLRYFPRENIHVVDGDALITNPLPEVQKVEKFLELEPQLDGSIFYFNQTKGFYCMRQDGEERCLNDTKGRTHPAVDPDILEKLYDFFRKPNKKFMELVGQIFNWPT